MAIEQRPTARPTNAPGGDQVLQKLRAYGTETMTELKKTTWPTKQEATRLTTVVIGVIIVLGIYMGTLDAIFSFLTSKFSLIK